MIERTKLAMSQKDHFAIFAVINGLLITEDRRTRPVPQARGEIRSPKLSWLLVILGIVY